MEQLILRGADGYREFDRWLSGKKVMVVCGRSYANLIKPKEITDKHNVVYFSEYTPNPVYESVVKGVELFNSEKCDAVVAVGGGSAMDVAKCIRLFHRMDPGENYLKQKMPDNCVPFLVIPTTAGTGSEATRYAVIYYNGEKQSVTSEYNIPDIVLYDPDNLKGLPAYHRRSTMMDALAHSIESMWSVNSTDESREYSRKALELIVDRYKGYLENTDEGNADMLIASYLAGRAINISQTTAGHAMSYKITSLFGCAHGHAAMMCNRKLYPWMIAHPEQCCDLRGWDHVLETFENVASILGCTDIEKACEWIDELFMSLEPDIPKPTDTQFRELAGSVNKERLKNNPVRLYEKDIEELYKKIFDMA